MPAAAAPLPEPSVLRLHGHDVCYRTAGSGPVVVLVHGIASSSATWCDVFWRLAEDHTVVAADLLGHGSSAKPVGDYSLGAYASGLRDLLAALGHDRVTLVGHSLGGGIAMQFAYQFPQRCARLVLVSSGGLGREVSVALRAAAIPGAELVLPVLTAGPLRSAANRAVDLVDRVGLRSAVGAREVAQCFLSLADVEARRAFLLTVRSAIDVGGQRVSASDRLYLAQDVPTLLVWGGCDRIIPLRHATAAHEAMPGSRLKVFPAAGHFPHRDEPEAFASLVTGFVASTAPAQVDEARIRALLGQATS